MTGIEIAAGVAALSGVVGAFGAIQQGRAAQQLAEFNAQSYEEDAAATKAAAAFEETRSREKTRRFLASQKARAAASGVVGTEGSPLLAFAETAQEGEIDALAIRYSGSVEEARALSAAQAERLKGRSARQASYFQATGSLLSGASRAASLLGED